MKIHKHRRKTNDFRGLRGPNSTPNRHQNGSQGLLEASWGRLGAYWGRLGPSWGPLGRIHRRNHTHYCYTRILYKEACRKIFAGSVQAIIMHTFNDEDEEPTDGERWHSRSTCNFADSIDSG